MGRTPARALLTLSLAALGCSDVDLTTIMQPPAPPRDDKMSVSGRFCTDPPQPADFPVRVLFVVDNSQSMNVTDPAPMVCNMMMCLPRRAQAILDVVNAYPAGNGVKYAVEVFSSNENVITRDASGNPGFTDDSNQIKTQLPIFVNPNGQTDYDGALDTAFMILQTDMISLDATARSRARYVIIFVSDGLPDPITAMTNTPQKISDRVKAIASLERLERLGEIKLNTVFLDDGMTPQAVQLSAEEQLADMARDGGGSFRTFTPGQPIRFFYLDFTSFLRVFSLKRLIVDNVNERPLPQAHVGVDSDGDGLLDGEEVAPGTDPLQRDTDHDGFNDLLEVRLHDAGFDPLYPGDADCALSIDKLDDDGDGLLNCEERFIGTNPRLMDTDADGVPDDVEFRLGTNPASNDVLGDLDFDGAKNGIEDSSHTNPNVNDASDFAAIAYRYDVAEVLGEDQAPDGGVNTQGRRCYDFSVANITLAPVLPAPMGGPPAGTNTILLRVASAPEDSPSDFGNHRIACLRPRYKLSPEIKEPPSGHIQISLDKFKKPVGDPSDPEVFNASRDCVSP